MGLRALLVEDSRAMRAYVSSILEAAGVEVEEVENGFEALRLVPRGGFDIVIADVNMPDVSGIELTRFVRRAAGYEHTPILVISTDGTAIDVQRALAAGATEFLAKPFTGEQLLEALTRLGLPIGGDA